MLKEFFNFFKKSSTMNKATEENTLDLEKLEKTLKELENKEEMKMLMKDYYKRNKLDKGGGSASSPVSSP